MSLGYTPPCRARHLGFKGSYPQHVTPSRALGTQKYTQGTQKCLVPLSMYLLLGWADLILGFVPSGQPCWWVDVPLGMRGGQREAICRAVDGAWRFSQGVQCGWSRNELGAGCGLGTGSLHVTFFFFSVPFLKIINSFLLADNCLRYCVGCCHASTWISHRYSHVPSLLNSTPQPHPTL